MKVIRDAVHGDIELAPNEMRLIHTAGFQRLHGCRQLGLTHLVYPSAKHSRFEHVLGVMHVATKMSDCLRRQRKLPKIAAKARTADHSKETALFFQGARGQRLRTILRLSALLHDMGHVPFGHTLEDEMPIISKHDRPSGRMESEVSQLLEQSGNQGFREEVLQTLQAISASDDDEVVYKLVDDGKIRHDLLVLADIIGNTICADLLDYIKRDHMMTGVRATYDNRILRYFAVGKHTYKGKSYDRVLIGLVRHGRVRGDCLADLLDLLKLRYNLSDKVLFHPKKCAASAMLIRAVHELGLTESDLMATSDEALLENHRKHPLIDMIRKRQLFKPVHISRLEHITSYHERLNKKELLAELRRDYVLRRRIEEAVEKNLKLRHHTVLIYCPKPDMTLKPVRVLVQWKDGTTRRLNELEKDDDPLTFEQVSVL